MQDKIIEYVTLEDGINYVIIDEIDNNDITYVYLTNEDNERDFCIRKCDKLNNHQILNGLDSDDEFDKALLLYTKKHQNDDFTSMID